MESRSWYETQRELERLARQPQNETPESRPAQRRRAAAEKLAQKKQKKQKEPAS